MLRTKILQLLEKPLKKYRKIKPKELKQIPKKVILIIKFKPIIL